MCTRMILISMDFFQKEELSMLCALGWILAGLLAVFIGFVWLVVITSPGSDPAGLNGLRRQVSANVNADMRRILSREDR